MYFSWQGTLFNWTLILHGTKENPLDYNPHLSTTVSPQPTEKMKSTKSSSKTFLFDVLHWSFCLYRVLYISDRIRKKLAQRQLKDSPSGNKCSDQPPGWEIGPSRMHVAWAYSAVCHVNTEPSNKVQQLSKVPSIIYNQYQGYLALKPQSPAK